MAVPAGRQPSGVYTGDVPPPPGFPMSTPGYPLGSQPFKTKPRPSIFPKAKEIAAKLPGSTNGTGAGSGSAGGSGLPSDPLERLATLFAGMFAAGSGAGRQNEGTIAVPVGPDSNVGGGAGKAVILVVLAAVGFGAWYWWKHRKGAGGE